jgi:outer membrane lipoprotein-sorting protein
MAEFVQFPVVIFVGQLQRTALFLTLSFLMAGWSQAGPEILSESDRTTFLNRLADSRKDAAARKIDFVETREVPFLAEPVRSEGSLAFAPPSKFRRETTGSRPSIIVCDGEVMTLYYPAFQEAEIYQLSRARPLAETAAAVTAAMDLAQLQSSFRVRVFALDNGGYRLELQPRGGALRRQIDSATLEIGPSLEMIASQVRFRDGSVTTSEYRNERLLPDAGDLFRIQLPEGTRTSRPLD